MNITAKLIITLSVAVLLASCGNNSKKDQKIGSDSAVVSNDCVQECNISLTVDKNDFPDNETFRTTLKEFIVKSSEYHLKNDSLAEIRLSNYSMEEFAEKLSAEQIDIMILLCAMNGRKLHTGEYKYMDFEKDYVAKVNLATAKGIIWFNWVSGMPEQGSVFIHKMDEHSVCGSLKLNVEKPENRTIGIVKLNGNFYIE